MPRSVSSPLTEFSPQVFLRRTRKLSILRLAPNVFSGKKTEPETMQAYGALNDGTDLAAGVRGP